MFISVYDNRCNLIKNSLKFGHKGLINIGIGSDNGLAPARRQAIIWTNDGVVSWRLCVSPGLGVLPDMDILKTVSLIELSREQDDFDNSLAL